ncbi:DUF2530 domain-containing protein [Cellulomonas sp. HZM]|uniref:DUF2530 domain-containing protein n=1 Tax=Cellulomonas sp. HZM TaxID=1454010 RepID=UPI00049340EE|nr:DUF2530 domain-containing protein [Cellulomonas sp. HZM]
MPEDHPPVEPFQVDFVRVMTVGTLVWVAALVVTLVLLATGTVGGIPVAVCAAGAALGLLGRDWAVRHRP